MKKYFTSDYCSVFYFVFDNQIIRCSFCLVQFSFDLFQTTKKQRGCSLQFVSGLSFLAAVFRVTPFYIFVLCSLFKEIFLRSIVHDYVKNIFFDETQQL